MLTRRHTLHLFCLTPLVFSRATASPVVPEPTPSDTCPVCGMHVAKYPEWIASVVFKDGRSAHFDGTKCMFRFVLKPERYAQGHSAGDIVTTVVKDYYDLTRIDARSALYVIGSDVLGPMGYELVPLAARAAVDDFVRDHGGSGVLDFADVTEELLDQLDRGNLPARQ
ncbi:MAG TPA: nitrous oxide reductase accessory protein NosL [Azospirillum sp.]|nr:nitrous oxide reductase accessory protein NosL [Azospirillum sp.]